MRFELFLNPLEEDTIRPFGIGSGGGGRPSGPGGNPSGPGGRPSGPGGRPSGPGGRPSGALSAFHTASLLGFDTPTNHIPDPNMRRADLDSLHPTMRVAANFVLEKLDAEGIPFRIFESFRSPTRQQWLYEQGRSRPGARVTNAKAWHSYHQYGLAADFVLWLDGRWSWSTTGAHKLYWKRLHAIGEEVGLEALSFELPHLQVAGLAVADFQRGVFPEGGDDSWRDNLEAAVIGWSGSSPSVTMVAQRPELRSKAR